MLTTVIGAVLPVIVALGLGVLAAWISDEDSIKARAINTMVVRYALPLSLFAITVATPRAKLMTQGPLTFILLAGMLIPFALAYLIRYFLSHDMGAAVLQALTFGFPAIPFVGIAILAPLIKDTATIVVAVGGIIINLILVPTTMVILSLAGDKKKGSGENHGASKPNQDAGRQSDSRANQVVPSRTSVGAVILKSYQQPLVWAPLLGLILLLCDITVPKFILDSTKFLGDTAGGVALFACGIVLYGEKPVISWPVTLSTLARNLLIPGLMLVVLKIMGTDHQLREAAVLALALPVAPLQVTLALEYRTHERENASTVLYSSVFSTVSIAFLITYFK